MQEILRVRKDWKEELDIPYESIRMNNLESYINKVLVLAMEEDSDEEENSEEYSNDEEEADEDEEEEENNEEYSNDEEEADEDEEEADEKEIYNIVSNNKVKIDEDFIISDDEEDSYHSKRKNKRLKKVKKEEVEYKDENDRILNSNLIRYSSKYINTIKSVKDIIIIFTNRPDWKNKCNLINLSKIRVPDLKNLKTSLLKISEEEEILLNENNIFIDDSFRYNLDHLNKLDSVNLLKSVYKDIGLFWKIKINLEKIIPENFNFYKQLSIFTLLREKIKRMVVPFPKNLIKIPNKKIKLKIVSQS